MTKDMQCLLRLAVLPTPTMKPKAFSSLISKYITLLDESLNE
ncbi:hypothetical protein VCSRO122_3515 [Vibrio cholerae]|nr:hypothetical protein VCSRO109_3643 [Vibrio cholerae]GHZ11874.1 hypothetical protein VCSRO122_3515 [Vibrio cholerae]